MTESDSDDILEPADKPKSARSYLAMIRTAQKLMEDYQNKAEGVDKLYANLSHLANVNRDREFQLFWANVQVLGPSVYSRPPVPVVVPKFKDRRPLYRVASELLERCSVVSFDMSDINSVMLLLRDDLNISARGVAWVRYETKAESDSETERVCFEHIDRTDFLHEPARNWLEVGWVARRAHLTKTEMRKRFSKTSGDAYKDAEYSVLKEDKDNGAADNTRKAGVWELWHKAENKVVWVTEGVDVLLDSDEPHLKLEGFFPCPRPAYATLQRRSLIPVPDMVYYKDQLEEINELTGRIHALSEALQVRGFYPAGAGEIGEAIETALKTYDNRQIMVPVSNWAAFGNGAAKDTIVWLPTDMVVSTIVQVVELRRQVIDDVYQIMGLSDIMRGSTEKDETATAQQIKAQFGSVRIRDKQAELVRIARDMVRIGAEIIAENFKPRTLLEMSQMEIPTDADIKKQADAIINQAQEQFETTIQQALQNPEIAQQAQQNPEMAQQMAAQLEQQIVGEAQQQIAKVKETPTVESVVSFLRDQRIRPFVLDIETDSTIQPDEDAHKQRVTEAITAIGGFAAQSFPMVQMEPSLAPFVGEMLKMVAGAFRVGREMEGTIDELVDSMAQRGQQPQPNPEADRAKAEAEAEAQRLQQEMEMKQQEASLSAEAKERELQMKSVANEEAMAMKREEHALAEDREMQRQMAEEKQGWERTRHDMDMSVRTTEANGKRIEQGLPPDEAWTLIGQEMAASREANTALIGMVAEGQQAIAQALVQMAEIQSRPKVVQTPDGREFTARTI
jgi:hypothetical protein